MAISRPLILCKSIHHGSTVRVAEAMGGVLNADIVAPESVPPASVQRRPLVGFGSGVYYGRMHEELYAWLQGLPDAPDAARPAFLFSTSGLPWLAWLWHRTLRHLLARKGFRLVGEFACRGFDTWGPLWLTGGLNRHHPDEHDLERARRFADRIAREVRPAEPTAGAA